MVSTQACADLLHQLPVLSLLKRDIRRSGTAGISALTVLAALGSLDGALAPGAPSRPGPGADCDPDGTRASCHRLGAVAEKLQIDPSVASRQVAQLIEMGAVERVLDPADHRVHLLRVTPSGHQELAEVRQRAAEQLAGRLTAWPEEDLQTLVDLLARLRADLISHPPDTAAPAPRPFPASPGVLT